MTNESMNLATGWLCPLYAFKCFSDNVYLSNDVSLIKAPKELGEYIHQQTRHLYGLWSDPSEFTTAICLYNTKAENEKKKSVRTETVKLEQIRHALKEQDRYADLLCDIVTALRLCNEGYVHIGPLVSFRHSPAEWVIGGTLIWTAVSEKNFSIEDPEYLLRETSVNTLKSTLLSICNLHQRQLWHSLNIPIEHFHSSYSGQIEDRIIDQMIAFEGLFLGSHDELTYKLAMRTAFLLGLDDQREIVFNDMKKAYNFRSRIVHGNDPPARNELRKLVLTAQEYLRRSIRAYFNLLLTGKRLKEIQDTLLDKNVLNVGKILR